MACDSEWNEVGAALVGFVAACATVETGVGAIACAAAGWAYYNAVSKLDECRRNAGLAAIDESVLNNLYAEVQHIQSVADNAAAVA
ncbi:hypothetical protein [Actinophytocola sp.]|uniref:hypothetical protein n=1 Tax=Actinophytocola sp. TaxID=1872138 RepID=UPI002D80508E|nr:hypothetical protein [Actinophytocola sp.]HET9142345.1 hypothetical protein [Actinophytocola sp.]